MTGNADPLLASAGFWARAGAWGRSLAALLIAVYRDEHQDPAVRAARRYADVVRVVTGAPPESRIGRHVAWVQTRLFRVDPHYISDPLHGRRPFGDLRSEASGDRSDLDDAWAAVRGPERVARLTRTEPEQWVRFLTLIDEAQEQGTGVIAAFPHAGSTGMIPYLLRAAGRPTTLVVSPSALTDSADMVSPLTAIIAPTWSLGEVLRKRLIDRGVKKVADGIITVGVEPDEIVLERCREALRRGHVLLITSDYFLDDRGGVRVDIAGVARKFPPGAAMLALQTGAPIVPLGVFHERGHFRLDLGDTIRPRANVPRSAFPLETRQLTRRLGRATERMLRRHPLQWYAAGHNDDAVSDPAQEARRRASVRDAGKPDPYADDIDTHHGANVERAPEAAPTDERRVDVTTRPATANPLTSDAGVDMTESLTRAPAITTPEDDVALWRPPEIDALDEVITTDPSEPSVAQGVDARTADPGNLPGRRGTVPDPPGGIGR